MEQGAGGGRVGSGGRGAHHRGGAGGEEGGCEGDGEEVEEGGGGCGSAWAAMQGEDDEGVVPVQGTPTAHPQVCLCFQCVLVCA